MKINPASASANKARLFLSSAPLTFLKSNLAISLKVPTTE
jgi:hypothetical protein